MTRTRDLVFISYCAKDSHWARRLTAALDPLVRTEQLALFNAGEIKAGAVVEDELQAALSRTKLAVVLISAEFLSSDRLNEHIEQLINLAHTENDLAAARIEALQNVPSNLRAHAELELATSAVMGLVGRPAFVLTWIPVGPCLADQSPISSFVPLWSPTKPLALMRSSEAAGALADIARAIGSAFNDWTLPRHAVHSQPMHSQHDDVARDDDLDATVRERLALRVALPATLSQPELFVLHQRQTPVVLSSPKRHRSAVHRMTRCTALVQRTLAAIYRTVASRLFRRRK